jgi:hypothetical protein
MKVRATERTSRFVDVEIAPREAYDALMADIADRLGIPKDVFLKDGKLYESEEQHGGSHSWTNDVLILASPTKEHLAFISIRDDLNELLMLLSQRDEERRRKR